MEYPSISVIVACLNEENYISQCLDSLVSQSYPGEIEILISDGGSGDGTLEIIHEYLNKHNNIILLNNPGKIQAAGRNLAISKSKFDLVAYLDGHSFADKDWLKSLYRSYIELLERGIKLAGVGSVHHDGRETDFTKASKAVMNSFLGGSSFSSFSAKDTLSEIDTAYACLYDKKVLIEAGLYDESYIKGEDLHLNLRITRKLKYKIYVDNNAVTYYYHKDNISSFAKQMFDYGFWRFKVMSGLNIYSFGPMIPMLFILFLLLIIAMTLVNINNIYYLIFTMIIYLFIIGLNSLFIFKKYNIPFFSNFIIQLTLHFNYGIGMIYSIFKSK